jgi:hypothetical protein
MESSGSQVMELTKNIDKSWNATLKLQKQVQDFMKVSKQKPLGKKLDAFFNANLVSRNV